MKRNDISNPVEVTAKALITMVVGAFFMSILVEMVGFDSRCLNQGLNRKMYANNCECGVLQI